MPHPTSTSYVNPSIANLLNPVIEPLPEAEVQELETQLCEKSEIIHSPPIRRPTAPEPPPNLSDTPVAEPSQTEVKECKTGFPKQAQKANANTKVTVQKDEEKNKKRRATVTEIANPKPKKLSKTEDYAQIHAPDLLHTMSSRFPGWLITQSAVWKRIQNIKLNSGDLENQAERAATFEKTIKSMDKHALIIDPKTVRHTKCGQEKKMKYPFNTENFKTHVAICLGPPKSQKFPTGGMHKNPLDSFFKTGGSVTAKVAPRPSPKLATRTCPGLTELVYPQISVYLDRTGAQGGGGESVSSIAHALFQKKYSRLNTRRKNDVKTAQMHTWKWRNDHKANRIFSTSCLKTISYQQDGCTTPQDTACQECVAVLAIKSFKSALNIARPPDENYKYLNKEYCHEKLAIHYGRCKGLREIIEVFILPIQSSVPDMTVNQDNTHGPLIRYCKGVISGNYKGNNMFGNLLQAVVIKQEKEARGVGMQNFKYTPDLVEFAHIIHTHSPKAYESLKEFFPLPSPRTLKFVISLSLFFSGQYIMMIPF